MPRLPTTLPLQEEIVALRSELGEYPNLEHILENASPEAEHTILKVLTRAERRSRAFAAFRKSHAPVA